MERQKNKRPAALRASRRRSLYAGAYAGVLAAAVLVVTVLLNLAVQAVPSKYTEFDISTSGLYTLSETTKTLLAGLDADVTAYYLAETGSEDRNVTNLLDRYAGETPRFRWQGRDPALYPTFAAQYDAADAAAGSVILVCGERHITVDADELYQYDYSAYYTTGSVGTYFAAESALSAGIAALTREGGYAVYELTGHGEQALGSDYTETLANIGVTLGSLNLTAAAVPKDAAALLLNAPTADLSAADVQALRAYLSGGGCLLVTTSLLTDTPNLDALLAEYGMARQPGLLVETDAAHYAYGYGGAYLLPVLRQNEVTAGVAGGMYVFAPLAQGIVADGGAQSTAESAGQALTHTALLSTSSAAYAMLDYATADTVQQGEDDPVGRFDLAVAAQDAATGARLVWVNCADFLQDEPNAAVSGGNAQLLGSIVNWMVGAQNNAVVEAKSMNVTALQVPTTLILPLGLLFVLLLPLACLLAGVAVTVWRRRR